MGAKRFDNFLRYLTAGSSRRGVLAGLAGGLLALLPLTRAGEDAAAKKKHKKRKNKKKQGSCSPQCSGGHICQGGTCVCPVGKEDSGGVCGTPPTCSGSSLGFCNAPEDCCNNQCFKDFNLCYGCSGPGQPCHVTTDCCQSPTPLTCVGFACTA